MWQTIHGVIFAKIHIYNDHMITNISNKITSNTSTGNNNSNGNNFNMSKDSINSNKSMNWISLQFKDTAETFK